MTTDTAGTRTPDLPAARPGRPRTEGHDERILDAALALVDRDEAVTVSAVVALSGVSRAALYRRWPSMNDLIAAALDRGRADIVIDTSGDVKEAIVGVMFHHQVASRGGGFSERRFRRRLALVMENRELQQAYWTSHVSRRRVAIASALQVAVDRGQLRGDLDLEACIDAINGVYYYQAVVRGSSLDDRETLRRCREAFEVVWRGMSAGEG
ncbi:TetR/AcrR family transcriptional regulator [Actinotalea sp. BY-33]|uniref:TetR/AcrR family transcriptional regulator n=1 Tax=Actinotalea soli TaxID=2819234 RepID=A0A939LNQ7_9CELL|nr:TetR/AcrR family transcriptional regulator [Actinotalea soli]MBO1751446.1 TetR/AcrR family transcriptional regulator [Actinotalea soli]